MANPIDPTQNSNPFLPPTSYPSATTLYNTATLRNIATRCYPMASQDSTKFYGENRTAHINRGSAFSAITMVLSTALMNQAGESATTGITTFKASIEYPFGTFTQFTWAGVPSVSKTGALGVFLSDVINLPIIVPRNAKFYIHLNQANPTGIMSPQAGRLVTFGDLAYNSTTAFTDHTMTGGEGNNTQNAFFPLALLAMSDRPSVLGVGDSRMLGYANANGFNSQGLGGEVCPSLCDDLPMMNVGAVAETVVTFLGSNTTRKALAAYATHVHTNYGINDLNTGATGVATRANLGKVFTLFSNKVMSCSTLLPIVGNATSQTVASWDAQRVIINNDMRSGANEFGYYNVQTFDPAIAVETSYNSGTYLTLPDGSAMTIEGTHLTTIGVEFLRRAKMFDTNWFYS